jgi:hypothetical protein
VQDELLEGVSPLGHDEEPKRRPPRGEDLLDRPAPGDELLVGTEEVRGRERISRAGPRRGREARSRAAWAGRPVW